MLLFLVLSAFSKFKISAATRMPLQLHDQSLKSSFKKILVILRFLPIISRDILEKFLILVKKSLKLGFM